VTQAQHAKHSHTHGQGEAEEEDVEHAHVLLQASASANNALKTRAINMLHASDGAYTVAVASSEGRL